MKINKLIKISILIIIFTILFSISSSVFAKSSITLSSSRTTLAPGENFTVSVFISPTDETAYTSNIHISYPSDLVSVVSFSEGQNWLSLTQTDYDLVDNVSGKLIKTAGYPKGIISGETRRFGTITFRAKTDGIANIEITDGTQIFNDSNVNTFSGEKTNTSITIKTGIVTAEQTSTTEEAATTTIATSTSQQATVFSTNILTSKKSLLVLLMIFIAGAISYGFYRKNSYN